MCDRDNDFFYGASWCVVAWLPVPWCRPTAKPPAQWRHQTAFVPPAPMTQKRQKQRNSTDKFAWRWAACRTRETTFLLLIWSLRELDARLPKSLFFRLVRLLFGGMPSEKTACHLAVVARQSRTRGPDPLSRLPLAQIAPFLTHPFYSPRQRYDRSAAKTSNAAPRRHENTKK